MTRQVLFVCVHNAGRSQMAEAFFNRLVRETGLDAHAESAGTEPADRLHPEVVDAMREVGIDLTTERPKVMVNDQVERADRVITMGCAVDAGVCPAVSVKDVEDWGLPDPMGQPLDQVRKIRDDIQRRVEALVAELR